MDRLEYDVARKDGIVRSNGTIAPECGVGRAKGRALPSNIDEVGSFLAIECDDINNAGTIKTQRGKASCENYYIPPPGG